MYVENHVKCSIIWHVVRHAHIYVNCHDTWHVWWHARWRVENFHYWHVIWHDTGHGVFHGFESSGFSEVQSIINVFHIVNKVDNVLKNIFIFDFINNAKYVEYVNYALYSSFMFPRFFYNVKIYTKTLTKIAN